MPSLNQSLLRFHREKHQLMPTPYCPASGSVNPAAALPGENACGIWIRICGSVACLGSQPQSAAMRQVDEDLETFLGDDVVLALPLDVGHESDAASVMFVRRVVKTWESEYRDERVHVRAGGTRVGSWTGRSAGGIAV